jgi:hypothetical protein
MAAKRRKQKPKKTYKRVLTRDPLSHLLPPVNRRPQRRTVTTTTTAVTAPGVAQYPREQDQHAVTTNQEPPATWPDVDLPPLTGFTTTEQPMDNGQANPDTIYNPATVETNPYYDYTAGDSSSGAGDSYQVPAQDVGGYQGTPDNDTGAYPGGTDQ